MGAPWPRPRRRPLAEGRPLSLSAMNGSPNSKETNRYSDFPSPFAAFPWSTPGDLRLKVNIVIPLKFFLEVWLSDSFVALAMQKYREVF